MQEGSGLGAWEEQGGAETESNRSTTARTGAVSAVCVRGIVRFGTLGHTRRTHDPDAHRPRETGY